MPWETKTDRRGFLGAGVAVSAIIVLLNESMAAENIHSGDHRARTPDTSDCKNSLAFSNGVDALAISPDGKLLAAGSFGNMIKLWSLPEGSLFKTLEGHGDAVRALAISPDGKILASCSDDKMIKLWSLPEGSLLMTLEGHKDYVHTLAISPDGKLLASGSDDMTIKLWSLPEGSLLKSLEGHKSYVHTLAISPDGKLLASGSLDKTIKLWNLPLGTLKTCLIDLRCSPPSARGTTYTSQNAMGQTITYTLPCGSPIPPGAICTCNCVPGSYSGPSYMPSHTPTPKSSYQSGGTYCSCNKVCTCVPVYR